VNFEIVKLSDFSGKKATIYSVIMEDEEVTLLDHFLDENEGDYPHEVSDIVNRLSVLGNITGAREHFFKEWEGKPGDGVCALYDNPDSNLRLYCIRYGSCTVIIGGGGFKPKSISALQEDKKLTTENYRMRKVSQVIMNALKEKDIRWSSDGMELIGDLKFIQDD
jgi:hypothetical protein